jgi:hypothetical protein
VVWSSASFGLGLEFLHQLAVERQGTGIVLPHVLERIAREPRKLGFPAAQRH